MPGNCLWHIRILQPMGIRHIRRIRRHNIKRSSPEYPGCLFDIAIDNIYLLLKPGGRFYMVHRPFRLVEIFQTMTKYKLEPKRMKLVYPMADREPNMVLIEGIRGAKSMIKIEKPLIVYEKPGVYTSEIYDIYGY